MNSNAATGEAETAATLLLAPRWPSRLLLVVRLLIFTQVWAVLIGVGNLVLHNAGHPVPVTLWTAQAIVASTARGRGWLKRIACSFTARLGCR